MKKLLNILPLEQSAQCGLCQDTLLRHINQSRIFWYCPSCRQEMLCEGQPTGSLQPTVSLEPAVDSCLSQAAAPQHKLTKKVADRFRRVGIQAS
ncbi:hypothetical protein [Leptothoe sp. PORK10 BA2]|uniref:hypothetical protein n=1 Tax=Leptothoe sp. PORK10 BA2 TaxID=3110254 RepID=UPI002B22036B|nr:hypothetical protein [Leptothoe sp. PORK10 BA2]MEA5462840.1 hypothetical protein [Leptothoe sp. PORK10 BA2]